MASSRAIEIACQILHVGVNGCSEHTGVDPELENVSKHVRGDPQLGCVERVDDDALDAQAPRVPEQRRKFLPVVEKLRPPALVRHTSGPPRCFSVAASVGKLVTLRASGATEAAHARIVVPLRQGEGTRVELPVAPNVR